MTLEELRARLVALSREIGAARRHGKHERAAALQAEYDREQRRYAAALDAADTTQGRLEGVR